MSAATKEALIAVTPALANGVGRYGMSVNALDPGSTDSGWIDEMLRGHLVPFFLHGRVGTPEKTRLASSRSKWVRTGSG